MSVPTPDFPNIYRVTVGYELAGLAMANVYCVAAVTGDADSVGADVAEKWAESIGVLISQDVFWTNWAAIELVPDALTATGAMSGFSPNHGTGNHNPVPPGAAMCVSLKTALGGRRHRGRNYIGGLPRDSALAAAGTWDTGAVSAMNSAYSDFVDALDGDGQALHIYSRGAEGTAHDFAPSHTLVTSWAARSTMASQRLRNTP